MTDIQSMPLIDLRAMFKAEEDRRIELAMIDMERAAADHGFTLRQVLGHKTAPKRSRGISPNSAAERVFRRMLAGASALEACNAEGAKDTSTAYRAATARGHRVVKGYLVKGDGL